MNDAGRRERSGATQDRATVPCATCGSRNVMTVGMLFDDDPISVELCSDCEARTWTRAGSPVAVRELVEAFRRTTRGNRG